jgi:uncharacterized integral membrane protein
MTANDHDHDHGSLRPRRATDFGLMGLGASVILLVWFAVANSTDVTISFWGFEGHTKVITVIALSAVLGGVAGFALGRRKSKSRVNDTTKR